MGAVKPKPLTLCGTCKTPSPQCSWKYNFTPVPGWDAEECELKICKSSGKRFKSYIVKSCPLYEENKREKKDIIEIPGLQNKYQRYKKRKMNS